MTKGRPRKPVEQLKKQATYRDDRHSQKIEVFSNDDVIQFPRTSEIPEIPLSLQDPGKALWEKVFNSPAKDWIQSSDMPIVELACMQTDMLAMAHSRFEATKDPADMRSANQCLAELVKLMSLLGLSPSDRARMGIQVAKTASTLQNMMAKRSGSGG